jgi:MFS family permease
VRAAAQVGEAGSAAIGGWLYSLAPRLPFWLQVPVSLLAAGIIGALREVPRRDGPTEHRSHLARALHIVRSTLWQNRRLQAAMVLSVALGLSTFVVIWLIQPAAQARGVPPAWFGPLWAGAHAWLALVSLASARVVRALGMRATLLGCCLLVPLGYVGLAASASAWGLGFYLCFMTVRGLQAPILTRIMQEHAPGEDRASVLSLAALLFRLAFVVVGPPVGLLVDRAGMPAALGVLAVVFTAATLAALGAFTRAHRGPPWLRSSLTH